jgi:hypothetical protein
VVGPAVGFDDQVLLGEEEVDLFAGDALVSTRLGKRVVFAELAEGDLEVAAGPVLASEVGGEDLPELARSAVAGVGSCKGIEGGLV